MLERVRRRRSRDIRSGPVAHDLGRARSRQFGGVTGTVDTNPAEATPYGWAGLERVGARAARHPARGGRGSPAQMLSASWALPSEDADVDPESARTTTIQEAVDQAQPGDVVCVFSAGPARERVMVTRSGTPNAPIRIRAVGEIQSAGFVVEADHVAIEGFSITNRGVGDDEGRGHGHLPCWHRFADPQQSGDRH